MLVDSVASCGENRPDARSLHQALLGKPAPAVPAARPAAAVKVRPATEDSGAKTRHPRVARGSRKVAHRRTGADEHGVAGVAIALVAGAARIDMRATTVVGRRLLGRLGADARFAAESQFILQTERRGWRLRPIRGTPNPTCVDGISVRGEVRLRGGEVVAIGSWSGGVQRLAMRVEVST